MRVATPMLKLFLASLSPLLLALPLLLLFADDAPARRGVADRVDDAPPAPTLMAMAPAADTIISPDFVLP